MYKPGVAAERVNEFKQLRAGHSMAQHTAPHREEEGEEEEGEEEVRLKISRLLRPSDASARRVHKACVWRTRNES